MYDQPDRLIFSPKKNTANQNQNNENNSRQDGIYIPFTQWIMDKCE
jgi:hypothetical protein